MKPVFCFDIDGTLLSADNRIHPHDLERLRAPVDFHVILASGRPLHAIRRMFRRHALFNQRAIPFPLVLQNGAALYGEGEKLFERTPFSADLQDHLLALCRSSPDITFFLLTEDRVFTLWEQPFARYKAEQFDILLEPYESGAEHRFSKLMGLSEDPRNLQEFWQAIAELPVNTAYSLGSVLEINPPGTDKGSGLQKILRAQGLSGSPVYAAGDGENDLPVFALSRLSFAPYDSAPQVAAQADHIIDPRAVGLIDNMLTIIGSLD